MIIDMFAGPGGWSEALKALGQTEVGIENDRAACDTAREAGHRRVCQDVRTFDPLIFEGLTQGLIASPPCQTFSKAGKGSGRKNLDAVLQAVKLLACGEPVPTFDDERTGLVLLPLRWALDIRPEWIALEQVPSVLPVWEAYADVLREHGYSVAVGLLNAEEFGVPQTRKRAVLIASRVKFVKLPEPTHTRYSKGKPRQQGDLLPWVSMADALGWDADELVGFPRKADEGRPAITIGDTEYRERDLREAGNPAQVVTEKARSWTRMGDVRSSRGTIRSVDEPAPTLTASMDNGNFQWEREPGVRVTVQEAAVLQSFRPDYPWQGSKTKQFEQVGNAIPPLMAEAILREAM